MRVKSPGGATKAELTLEHCYGKSKTRLVSSSKCLHEVTLSDTTKWD